MYSIWTCVLCLRSVRLMTAPTDIRITTDCLQLYKNSKSSVISSAFHILQETLLRNASSIIIG